MSAKTRSAHRVQSANAAAGADEEEAGVVIVPIAPSGDRDGVEYEASPPRSRLSSCVASFDSLSLVVAVQAVGGIETFEHHELVFDWCGCSQTIDVSLYTEALLVVHQELVATLTLEAAGNECSCALGAISNPKGLTTLRVPQEASVVRVRLRDHVRGTPAATIVGRLEDA